MEDDKGLTIEFAPTGRNGMGTLTARLAGDVLHVERTNPAKSKDRAEFAKAVCTGRPGINPAAVEAELAKLAANLANKPEVKDAAESKADLLATMPESIRTEAREMLESPDLLKRVVDDIGTLGVAGEKELSLTIYLVGTSRFLPKPLAAIVQGPTSSGKSYVSDKVALPCFRRRPSCMPPR